MKECSAARDYQATRPPTCNGGDPCDACRAKWAAAAAVSLESFASDRRDQRAPGACKVCDLFARLPELRVEVDAGRQKFPPISFDNIAGYVALKYGVKLSGETWRRHYGGHR